MLQHSFTHLRNSVWGYRTIHNVSSARIATLGTSKETSKVKQPSFVYSRTSALRAQSNPTAIDDHITNLVTEMLLRTLYLPQTARA